MPQTIGTKRHVSLILPAYNEAAAIGRTIDEAQAYFERRGIGYEIIVAADGDDGTREIIDQRRLADPTLQVLGSVQRRGKGFGIRQAVMRASGDIVGFADADNKTPISELDKVLPLFDQGYAVVIGSRRLRQSKIERRQPWYRRAGSRGFAVLLRLVIGLPGIPDTQCGFKFFTQPVARDLFSKQRVDGYMFDVEILHLARLAGYRLGQVAVRWRDDGDTRSQLVRGNLRSLKDVLSIRMTRYDVA